MLVQLSLKEFSNVLGSDSPAPGGGSVAALSGALGADLVSMVCSLSVGKPQYEEFHRELEAIHDQAKRLSTRLLERVDLDTKVFNDVMAAFKLPKATDEEKNARTKAIQAGYKEAIKSPLNIARECLEVLKLAEKLLGKSNSNALSDLGVAAQQAYAGLEGAVMNVKINVPSIQDESFATLTSGETRSLLEEGNKFKNSVNKFVSDNMS